MVVAASLNEGENLPMGMDRDGLQPGFINTEALTTGATCVNVNAAVNFDEANSANQAHCNIAELIAQEAWNQIFEGVEGMNDYIEGQVYSDSESGRVFEHLAKENLVVSDSDIPSAKNLNGK
ncbi:hypothetical protein I3842_10G096200 [Carya illinoinensis]|uniref:Uncharacterized protein n=1 Tax=Carya illinoinensis TaxID=32201 RepID=A0A922J2I5_CARIL|nr:hypothetical protein I3842_10G096200 [Carya illinoinensis]